MNFKKYLYLIVPILVLITNDMIVKIYHDFDMHWLFSAATSVLIIGIVELLIIKPGIKKGVIYGIVTFSIIYSAFLSSYFTAFHTVFSFGNIGRADDLTGIVSIIPEYINGDTLLYVVIFIAFTIFYRKVEVPVRNIGKRYIFPLIVATAILLTANYSVLLTDFRLPILNNYGIHTYMAFDISSILDDSVEEVTRSDIKSYISSRNYLESDNQYSGVFEGKNIVFVMVESLEDHIIDDHLPHLAKMKSEGMYFSNYYIPRYQAITADSEFIYNTSQIPLLRNGVTYRVYAENTYSVSMVNSFENKGYHSYYFHDYFGSFYHRKDAIGGLGYDNISFVEEMNIDVEQGMMEMPKDVDMINASFEMYDFEEPFITYYTTVSGHQKYERPSTKEYADEYAKALEGQGYDDVYAHYLGSIRHSDDAIGLLVEKLEETNKLDDTVIVVVSDHMAKSAGNDRHKFVEGAPHLSYKGPFLIWSNDMDAEEVNTLASSFDVFPTLANMFNLEVDINNYVGTDIFSENERFIPFYDNEWLTNEGFYCAPKMKYFAFDDGIIDIAENNERVKKIHEYGQAILYQDYFKVKE